MVELLRIIKGTKENNEENDNEICLTRTEEGEIFFTKNVSYEDENFIFFYKDQIPELIKSLKELKKGSYKK